MSGTIQHYLTRRRSWSRAFVIVGLVFTIGAGFAVLPFVVTAASLLHVRLHFPRGTGAALRSAGIVLACYGYFRPLKCPICGKAISPDEDEPDDLPGFCPNCVANLHKPMPDRPAASVT
jgi:hypothetical protein